VAQERMANSVQRKQLIARKHEQSLIRRIVLIVILTFGIIAVLLMYAIPAMVKIADVWETTRDSDVPTGPDEDISIPLSRPSFQSLPYNATNSSEFILKGYAPSGTTVFLRFNNQDSGTAVADNSGSFTISNITLSEGDNSFVVYAKDTKGKKSEESEPLNLKLDTRPPTLEISGPNYGDTFGGSQNVIDVKGKTSEATQMYVNEGWVIMNADGSFSHKFQLQPGENTLTMYAKDDAGNKSAEVIRKVTYNP
jgi:hypothetical protein